MTILGVSKDSIESHHRFREKQGLTFDLLSDAEGDTCERYGVWREKKMYGKTHMGIERTTFVIGADTRVEEVFRRVRVDGHVEALLAAIGASRA